MDGRIEFLGIIKRDMLRVAADARFVFGDNLVRRGMAGQAAEMRGEPNAIGVATKRHPGVAETAYFSDDSFDDFTALCVDIAKVRFALDGGRLIYIPKAGLGTGLSQLPTRAPKLYRHLYDAISAMAGGDIPWKAP